MSARGSQEQQMEKGMVDAICFIVLEKSYPLHYLRKLDVASFLILLEFVEKQAQQQQKALAKAKKGKK